MAQERKNKRDETKDVIDSDEKNTASSSRQLPEHAAEKRAKKKRENGRTNVALGARIVLARTKGSLQGGRVALGFSYGVAGGSQQQQQAEIAGIDCGILARQRRERCGRCATRGAKTTDDS
ncbi:hypothetical protein CTheo_2382 [Ceratobasidium theobromae]|uniref:Uncharacterized protein n=1 Tax=Ceratobasidium theobromae TaxID=1582974 RepID=A0A5N5QSL8_9AGAM|nr:hypothetical protein CTheo_2382 [Ceratobasidium theobromae]